MKFSLPINEIKPAGAMDSGPGGKREADIKLISMVEFSAHTVRNAF